MSSKPRNGRDPRRSSVKRNRERAKVDQSGNRGPTEARALHKQTYGNPSLPLGIWWVRRRICTAINGLTSYGSGRSGSKTNIGGLTGRTTPPGPARRLQTSPKKSPVIESKAHRSPRKGCHSQSEVYSEEEFKRHYSAVASERPGARRRNGQVDPPIRRRRERWVERNI